MYAKRAKTDFYDLATMNKDDISTARKRAITNMKNAVSILDNLGIDFFGSYNYNQMSGEFVTNEGYSARALVLKSRKTDYENLIQAFKFAQLCKEMGNNVQIVDVSNSNRRTITQRLLTLYRKQCNKPNVTCVPFKMLSVSQRILNWPEGVGLTSNAWTVANLQKIDAAIRSVNSSIQFLPLNALQKVDEEARDGATPVAGEGGFPGVHYLDAEIDAYDLAAEMVPRGTVVDEL